MKKLVLLAAAASLGLAVSAVAGNVQVAANSGVYAGVNGGIAIPVGESSGYSDALNTGWDLGAQLGYRFNKNFRAELAANYLRNNVNTDFTFGAVEDSSHVGTGLFMVNGYYDFDFGSALVPFLGAGVGLIHQAGELDTVFGDISGSENSFAYQGIAGLAYKLNQNVSVDVAYHYVGWTNDSYGASQNLVNLGLNYYFA